MSVRNRVLGAILLALLIPTVAVATPLGRSFTYQGELNQSGTPVDGTVHLRFSLWDAAGAGTPPTGGTQIGSSQIVANVSVDDGLFTAEINAGDQFGASAFNGQARWLQIEVCTDGSCTSSTVLGPRQALTAAPYALGPWQIVGTNLNYSGGNVGIGTSAPAHPLHIKSNAPAVILEDTAIASNQAGYLGFWNSTTETGWMGYGNAGSPDMTLANARPSGAIVLWANGERLRVNSAGNVGIGTSAPTGKLDVRGTIKVGTSGEYFVPAADGFNLRIVRGVVSNVGTRVFGTGFAASRTGTGVYEITFDTAFVDQPSITATCQHPSLDRIAIISTHFASSCTIRVVSGSGTPVDCYFDIIAIGRR
jgi:hypothetical protein